MFDVPGFWHCTAHGTVTNNATTSITVGLVDVAFQGVNSPGTDVAPTTNATFLKLAVLGPGESASWIHSS